jgi:EAL domain-containing protein (putative c-di-GMP-specific phosphodiesterase class I)
VAQKIIDQLVTPHSLGTHEILVSCSIGIAIQEARHVCASQLLKAADSAMYQAKHKGRSQYAYYSADLEAQAIRKLELARALNEAIDHDQLSIFFQPQLSAVNGHIIGMEALMRWQLNGEWIGPYEFIPIAEECGLIPKLGEWMLLHSCLQLKQWQDQRLLPDDMRVAVNISNRQLQAGNFLDILERAISESGIAPACLELELTESAVMSDPNNTISIFERIHELGVEIAVDDFGTGYSSLSYLRKLPLDTLKIDRSFVQDLDTDTNDRAIVNAIIGLAHNLGLQVVAEGVETEPQRNHLVDQGCDILQGYLFSRPLPAREIPDFVSRQRDISAPSAT